MQETLSKLQKFWKKSLLCYGKYRERMAINIMAKMILSACFDYFKKYSSYKNESYIEKVIFLRIKSIF